MQAALSLGLHPIYLADPVVLGVSVANGGPAWNIWPAAIGESLSRN